MIHDPGSPAPEWWWTRFTVAFVLLLAPIGAANASEGKIRVLMTGKGAPHVEAWLLSEPLVEYLWVPGRDYGYGLQTMNKMIRLYFPRTYEGLRSYDFLLLDSVEMYFFSNDQVERMHDAILDGTGAMNTGGVMSQIAQIHNAWAASILSEAFPNDAAAVVARGQGGTSPIDSYHMVIKRDFPDPVLTPFIPFKVEEIPCSDGRRVILREGALAMAYQAGNFPGEGDVPLIAAWEYGKATTLTTGDRVGWRSYFSRETWMDNNPYIPDMFKNLIFYSTGRKLIDDVLIYHQLSSSFLEVRTRLAILVSLTEFIDKYGARSDAMQDVVMDLQDKQARVIELYLDGDFIACNDAFREAQDAFAEGEAEAMRLKDEALLWVYLVEWLATTATLMFCSFLLWTLMVRRRLYREVSTTRLT
jgi:hypothetical protein